MDYKLDLIIFFLVTTLFFFFLWRRNKEMLSDITFRKSSLSSRYGKMTEQFMPFLKDYPYDPSNFRFLGSPIDGVQFEEDKIVLIEFKAAGAGLSPKQKQIAELAANRRIVFEEHRIE